MTTRPAAEDEAFPRGKPEEGDEEHREADGEPKKKTRKRKGKKEEEEEETGGIVTTAQEVRMVPRLRHNTLPDGSLILAAVRDISEEELILNLPYNLVGYVGRTDAVDVSRFDKSEATPKLSELYSVGQLVAGVVTAVVDVKEGGKNTNRIELSLRPALANAGLDAESLVPHMTLPAVVQDEQEHVFRLDLGIAGFQGLLKKTELADYPVKVCPGCIIQVVLQSVSSSGSVRCALKHTESLGSQPLKFEALKPGFLVQARVDKVMKTLEESVTEGTNLGLVVNFCGSLIGVIHGHYQGPSTGGDAEVGHKQRVTARVLAILPGARITVHLALVPHLLDWTSQGKVLSQSAKVGQRLESKAMDFIPRYGCRTRVTFKGQSDGKSAFVTAFCPISRMTDKGSEQAMTPVTIGEAIACRVLAYNFLDGALIVTRRPSDLKEGVLVAVTELTPGQSVMGTVVRIADYGAMVKLSEFITGLCHIRQLTDVPLATVSKKIQVEQKIKCRVLQVYPERRQITLTAKKQLLKDDFQFNDFSQVRLGMLVTGYVATVQPYGAIVQFYGDMFGLLPPKEMESDMAPALGMTVKVKIASANAKTNKIALSLNLSNGKTPEEAGAHDPSTAGNFTRRNKRLGPFAGELASEMRAILCTAEGVYIQFKAKVAGDKEKSTTGDKLLRGFIPTAHLGDTVDDAKAKYDALVKKLGGVKDAPIAEDTAGEEVKGKAMKETGVVLNRRFNPKRSGTEEEDKDLLFTALVSMKPSVCTAVEEGEFVKSFEALEEGKAYAGYVKDVRNFGALISVGSWKLMGLVPRARIATHVVERPQDELSPGQTVRVRICGVNLEARRFTGDLRPEGSSEPTVVVKEVGGAVTMEVKKVQGNEVLLRAPGVTGHIHATHLVDKGDKFKPDAEKKGQIATKEFEVGAHIEARVLSVRTGETPKGKPKWHLELTCRPSLMADGLGKSDFEGAVIKWKNLEVGKWVTGVVTEVQKRIIWLEVAQGIFGRVLPLEVSTEPEVVKGFADYFQVGQVLQARVLKVDRTEKLLDLSFVSEDSLKKKEGKAGSTVSARLEKMIDVKGKGIVASFKIPGGRQGYLHVTECFDHWAEFPLKQLKPWKLMEVAIAGTIPDADGKAPFKGLELSLRPSQVYGKEEATSEKRPMHAKDLQKGQTVSGYVVTSGEKGVFVALSRRLVGRIQLKFLADELVLRENVARLYPPGKLIREAKVMEVDLDSNRVGLSLRKGGNTGLTLDQISVGDTVSGYVKAVQKYGFFMRLNGSSVDGLVHAAEISDSASASIDSFKVGDKVRRAKVTKIDNGKLWLSVKPSLFEGEAVEEEEDDVDKLVEADLAADEPKEEAKKSSKRKKKVAGEVAGLDGAGDEAGAADSEEEDAEEADPTPKKRKKALSADKKETPAVDSDDEAPWDRAAAATTADSGGAGPDMASFVFSEFKGNAQSSSEGEDEDDDGEDETKKLSKRQKQAQKKAAEEELRQREADNAEGRWANDPRSVEDFERLVLTQGGTSIIWIRYMAFHLKMSDLERARQVAERAVKHVGFSESRERFNAWVAFMNLECTFGTEETSAALFKRAIAHNDPKQAHLQYAKIHDQNKKTDLAIKAYEAAAKKFPQSKTVWLDFLTLLYKQSDLEGARKTLPKALAAVPKAKHAMVVSKTAILEYTHGSIERGRSIFEGLLDSYPKRTDLWSIYLDAHIKGHTPPRVSAPDLKEIRSLMERCCTLTLKPIKMRFFFKRWLDFEKKWGDEESEELVRSKARAFVESQGA